MAVVVRQYAVPLYVNTFYRQPVDDNFAAAFTNVNNELVSLGFTQYRVGGFHPTLQTATCYNHVTDGGQSGYYHGLSETVPCIKHIVANPFVPDDAFTTLWTSGAPNLVSAFAMNGWKMTRNLVGGSDLPTNAQNQQAIANIFNVPNRSPADQDAAEIDYSKTIGNSKCYFSLTYANDGPSPVKSVWLDESCERDVSIFGGSSG
ncbi:MAG: hypothetical protein ACHQT9_05115 [Candidatus Saccharimonadales bacterium]